MSSDAVTIYLDSLGSEASRRSSRSKLDVLAKLEGSKDALDYPWHTLTPIKVKNLINRYQNEGRRAADSSAPNTPYDYKTVNAALSALKGVLKNAWLAGEMDGDTYLKIQRISQIKGQSLPAGQALSKMDIDLFFDKTPDDVKGVRDKAILSLGFDMGFRREEIAKIQINQVFFRREVVRVLGKGNKEREVALNERAKQMLQDWLAAIDAQRSERIIEGDMLFGSVSKAGRINHLKGIDVATVWRVFKSAAQRTGQEFEIPPTPHDMRRSRITQWLDVGSVRTVQKLAGHSHVQTTMGYDRANIEDEMRRIQQKAGK